MNAMLDLLRPERRPARPVLRDGYLDLLSAGDPTGGGPGQRLMVSRALPEIYERIWRPLGGRLLMGPGGPDTAGERRIALEMLSIGEGDAVLDVACGPGNFTRAFAAAAGGDGVVVGLDASSTMLARAASERPVAGETYVRASATDLPFRDGSFDAVCCFAALYLIEDPLLALAEIVRVLAPGSRVALLSSVARGPVPARVADAVVRPLTGVRIFGRDELARELRASGLVDVTQRVAGFAQFVSARKKADSNPPGTAPPRARARRGTARP